MKDIYPKLPCTSLAPFPKTLPQEEGLLHYSITLCPFYDVCSLPFAMIVGATV